MPPFLINLLVKLGPYAAVALMALGLGGALAHRWDLGVIASAQLALANQQGADAKATAKWNQEAADFQARIGTLENNVQAARQARQQADASAGAAQEAVIAAERAQPGRNGAVASVLKDEHDNLAQLLQGAGK